MMNHKSIFYIIILSSCIVCATQVSGTVKNLKLEPILYANVYIENTFDGDDTDENGDFVFLTEEQGKQNLIVAFVGYEKYTKEIILENSSINLDIVLIEKENQSNEVVITAGAFEASDENRVVILNPIDIVTTAGSRGDITGALQALPGSQPQAEQEGLFVRGGDASESKTIVDGLLIQNPYFSSVPDIPQRGRFTPFEFEGTVFSTGGYSAQYGQALSSIVDLTTWNRFGDVNANTFGVTPLSISYGRPFGTEDITCGLNLNYTNLKSYYDFNNSNTINDFIKNTVSFIEPPEGYQINTNFKRKYDNGVYKFYARFSANDLALDIDNGSIFNLKNDNLYISSIYKGIIENDWSMNLGASYSENNDDRYIFIQEDNMNFNVPSFDNLLQFRANFSKSLFSNSLLRLGLHFFDQNNNYIQYRYNQDDELPYDDEEKNIDELLSTGFTEFDIKLSRNIAARLGFRFEYSELLNKNNFAPRFSFAYKLGAYDQLAYAYGEFYQTPDLGFDQWYRQVAPIYDSKNLNLDFERASHHILNYQWVKRNQVFRVEFYDKDYTNLITIGENLILDNSGYGYAKGIDVFWRDNKHTFENIDFWLSYSYLDTKRKYREYPDLLTPSFAAEHVLSLIYKQMFEVKESQFQFSMGYTFASGRPYYNKFNNFEKGMTDNYQAFNIGGSIIPPVGEGNFLVIFFNLENPFGYKNTYGYRFADYNNLELEEPQEIHPSSLRSFFIGCFMFLDNSKK